MFQTRQEIFIRSRCIGEILILRKEQPPDNNAASPFWDHVIKVKPNLATNRSMNNVQYFDKDKMNIK